MKFNEQTLTPAVAKQWLATMAGNRPQRRSHIKSLAEAMLRGEWRHNGQPIIFADDGALIDGQHRCQAVILAGVPVQVLVVNGVSRDAFATIDRGIARAVSDYLFLKDEKDSRVLASMLAILADFDAGKPWSRMVLTPALAMTTLDKHPLARKWAAAAAHCRAARLAAGTPVAAMMVRIEERAGSDADLFFEALRTGANLAEASPILTLRNRLISDTLLKGSGATVRKMVGTMTVRAWNAWVRGESLTKMYAPKADLGDRIELPRVNRTAKSTLAARGTVE